MSWIPQFLSPLTGAIAAAVAVPLLLVLYFLKLRRREVTTSSTLLWKKAIQDLQVNAPFQRLRRNLLLLLQLLLLVALCVALMRPVTFFTPGAGRSNVILIDRSASMNTRDMDGESRLDFAKRRAIELIDTMGRNATAMVIAFDDRAEIMQPFTSDTVALKNAVRGIRPSDRPTSLKLAYQLAEASTNFDPEQLRANAEPADVWLFSDGRVRDDDELSIRGNLRFESIGSQDAPNVAIVALNARRNYERPNEVTVFARFANHGPEPVVADVEMLVSILDPEKPDADDFRTRSAANVSLLPERWTEAEREQARSQRNLVSRDSVEFTFELTSAAVIRVEHKFKNDLLGADDAASVVVPPPRALAVCLVTEGNYFLERLITQAMELQNPVVMTPQQYESQVPTNFDVIIFDRAYQPAKLPAAGNFIYLGAVPEGLKVQPRKFDGRTVRLDIQGVLDFKRDHPILRGLSLARVQADQALALEVPLDSEVLIEGTKGALLVLHREGRSVHLICAFDTLQSTWPTLVSFPVFMYQTLQYLALGSDLSSAQTYVPGSTPRISRASLQKLSREVRSFRLRLPDGTSRAVEVPEAGDFVLPALERVGIYQLDPLVPDFERIAVNLLDDAESNTLPLTTRAPGNIGEAIVAGTGRSRLDLWWWIIAAFAMPLLLVEWWIYTRRVHL